MDIDKDEAKRIAELARLGLDDDDAKRLAEEMAAILECFRALREADVEGVLPWIAPVAGSAPERPDIVEKSRAGKNALDGAPDRAGRHFRVPRVIG